MGRNLSGLRLFLYNIEERHKSLNKNIEERHKYINKNTEGRHKTNKNYLEEN